MTDIKTLKEILKDWTDFDVAEYYLGCCLGLNKDERNSFTVDYKHIFWTHNDIGNTLGNILMQLKDIGVLEYDPDEIQYKWNEKFKMPKGNLL